ncbi:hypothetical protein BDV97DRAFT_303927 [Delphinella strobiligena]|nr:hypothetical protein BDV97DRAFT_303927 [Delphinella strobiligena]
MASTTRLRQAFGPIRGSLEQSLPVQRYIQHGLSPRSHGRTFSTTRASLARPGRGNTFIPQMPTVKTPSQKSMNVAFQEQKAMAVIPDDIGFLPRTFIMPHGRNLPSLTSNFSGRYKLEKARFIQRVKDMTTTGAIKFFYVRDADRTRSYLPARFKSWFRFPNLSRTKIPSIATGLYEEMYTNFAKGTIDNMRAKLCESIHESLKGRIVSRPPNTSLRWTLHRYIGSPRVVSHKYMPLSAGVKDKYKQTALQQAVVRIRSMQSLERVRKVRGRDGKVSAVVEEGSSGPEGKEVVEYFVVQRMTRKGKVGPWKVWGTTEEMTLEKLEAEEKK